MKKVAITDTGIIEPFGEVACDLPILNEPLRERQRQAMSFLPIRHELRVSSLSELRGETEEMVVYRDNLLFDKELVRSFIDNARILNSPSQVAFSIDDAFIIEHALRLQTGIKKNDNLYVADLFYYPRGYAQNVTPIKVSLKAQQMWYLSIPTKERWLRKGLFAEFALPRTLDFAPIRLFVPSKSFMSIESWVHLLFANVLCGIFVRAQTLSFEMRKKRLFRLGILGAALLEGRRPLSCSKLVRIGKNCQIDPSAIILGPTVIGDETIIEPGAVIASSVIGNKAYIGQGCNVRNSVIGHNCTLPFRTSAMMSCVMDNTILNSIVRFSIIGRNCFIGDGIWFADRNLRGHEVTDERLGGEMVSTMHRGKLEKTGYFLLGSGIGHEVRIAAGHVIYPGRTVNSGSTLILDEKASCIVRN